MKRDVSGAVSGTTQQCTCANVDRLEKQRKGSKTADVPKTDLSSLMNLLVMNFTPSLPADRDSESVEAEQYEGISSVIHFITVCQVDQPRQ